MKAGNSKDIVWLHVTVIIEDSKTPNEPLNASKGEARAQGARLRKLGLRPIQFWVPDVRSAEFSAEAHQQTLAVAMSPEDDEDQAFIDAVSS